MLQEISESSSNRIVQRTSWSRERLLGLRNRSIFILLLIRSQLLASADAQPEQKHAGSVHARMHMYASFCLVSFLGMNGWKRARMSGWVGEWMDATELEEGEIPRAFCLFTGLPTGGRCVCTPPPPRFRRFYTIRKCEKKFKNLDQIKLIL